MYGRPVEAPNSKLGLRGFNSPYMVQSCLGGYDMASKELIRSNRELVGIILPTLQTGDIILTSCKSIIATFMHMLKPNLKISWGHCMLVKDQTTAWEAKDTIRENSIITVLEDKEYWRIVRYRELTSSQQDIMRRIIPIIMGCDYSFKRLMEQLLDKINNTTKYTDEDTRIDEQVCSSLVAWSYKVACRYKFNDVSWESCDPNDVNADFDKYPDRWLVISERLPKNN